MNTLETISALIRDCTASGPVVITRETTATDVRGWDSLSHTMIVVAIEEKFAVQLPTDRIVAIANVGDLVDLVEEAATASKAR